MALSPRESSIVRGLIARIDKILPPTPQKSATPCKCANDSAADYDLIPEAPGLQRSKPLPNPLARSADVRPRPVAGMVPRNVVEFDKSIRDFGTKLRQGFASK